MEQAQDVVDFKSEWYKTAEAPEQEKFRAWLLELLRSNEVVEVTFTKKDGTLREMKCTLKEGIIPKVENPKESDKLCTVWDTVLEQWRSFHFENITKINFTLG